MKYFTVANTAPPSETRWHRIHWNRTGSPVLVFGSDDEYPLSLEDQERIAQDESYRGLFPRGYFVHFVPGEKDRILVHDDGESVPPPDSATLDDPPVLIRLKGWQLVPLSNRRLYDTCLSLFRAVGCLKCPDRGKTCAGRLLENYKDAAPETNTDQEEVITGFRNRKTQIAGFTYISPVLTKSDRYDHFAPANRSWTDQDFTQIQRWVELRQKAAVTRADRVKFKKEQCANCPMQKSACQWNYRHWYCDGRFPPDEEITEWVIEERKDQFKDSGYAPWQVMLIAQQSGLETQLGRRKVILDGFNLHMAYHWRRENRGSGEKITITASRNATSADLERDWPTYAQVAEAFGLPKRKREAQIKPVSDLAYALWLATLEHETLRRRSAGFGSYYDKIGYRKLLYSGVELGLRGRRGIWTTRTISSWAEFFDAVGAPPVDQIKVERAPR